MRWLSEASSFLKAFPDLGKGWGMGQWQKENMQFCSQAHSHIYSVIRCFFTNRAEKYALSVIAKSTIHVHYLTEFASVLT